jgi:hypothetical protein
VLLAEVDLPEVLTLQGEGALGDLLDVERPLGRIAASGNVAYLLGCFVLCQCHAPLIDIDVIIMFDSERNKYLDYD